MKLFILLFISVVVTEQALATDYYCNGQYKKSGSTEYYPNCQYVNSGSTKYYPNGQYINSGSTKYYPNGQYMNSGSTKYYANGQYINSGSTRYYSNGQYINSGSSCYYESGTYMGSCPESVTVTEYIDGYEIELEVYIKGSDVIGSTLELEYSESDYTVNFDVDTDSGDVSYIRATCNDDSGSSRVDEIMNLYNSSSLVDQNAVKERICN